ncbi:inositol-phosphate phosphatase-like isoform X2 [Belonocnema kinseyi]|uniref:inositol-phosphate phosphatase-like isoform X2 n=1 Tax=Belonocnema kinseyi TaxID=2817044 RepID=UPI00143DE181|nr:inositol-phosphate phosphatase-like isoform X2 [Belonocnema kinseyi]
MIPRFLTHRILSLISLIRKRLQETSYLLLAFRNTSSLCTMADAKDINRYFEIAKKLTLEAGKIIKSATDTEKLVESKSSIHSDLVTEYDKEVENILIGGLSKEFPDHKFIAEELSAQEKSIPELTDDPTWIIDPIDGTTNFVHGYPESCISIGLTIDKEVVIGIIYNPDNCHLYTAKKNEGAFLNGVRLQTSSVTEVALIHESMKNRDIYAGRLEALATVTHGIRGNGSAALSLAYVARGIVDIYQMHGLKPWDVAPAILLIQEAGGIVTDLKGQPFSVMKSKLGIIAASNKQLVKEVTKLIIETDLKTQRKRLKRTEKFTSRCRYNLM